MENNRKPIVEIVTNSSILQKTIVELKEKGFLLDGIFNPLAYLRDTDKIEFAWKKEKSRINTIAMGVSLYNDFFMDGMNSAITSGDFIPSKKTQKALGEWEKKVKNTSLNYEEIEDICRSIGQYLEYMNRKSQGF